MRRHFPTSVSKAASWREASTSSASTTNLLLFYYKGPFPPVKSRDARGMLVFSCAMSSNQETNPLLEIQFRIPFDRIRAEHVEPAIEDLLRDARAKLEALADDTGPP